MVALAVHWCQGWRLFYHELSLTVTRLPNLRCLCSRQKGGLGRGCVRKAETFPGAPSRLRFPPPWPGRWKWPPWPGKSNDYPSTQGRLGKTMVSLLSYYSGGEWKKRGLEIGVKLSKKEKKKVWATLSLARDRKFGQAGSRGNSVDGNCWHLTISFPAGVFTDVLHLPFLLSDVWLYWNHSSPHRHWFGRMMAEHMSGCFSDVTIVHCDMMWSWDTVTETNLSGWGMSKCQQICPGFWGQLKMSKGLSREFSESASPH